MSDTNTETVATEVKAEELVVIDAPVAETTTVEPVPAKKAAQVLKQLEYYFGDSNLRRDKFLLGECAKHPESFVSIAVINSFQRMKAIGLYQYPPLPYICSPI
eukprot:g12869.t1